MLKKELLFITSKEKATKNKAVKHVKVPLDDNESSDTGRNTVRFKQLNLNKETQ